MAIGIDMDLDLDVIERSHYTILDVLSDVGGIASVTTSIVALILSILNYNNLDSQMIRQLFKFPSLDNDRDVLANSTLFYKPPSVFGNIVDFFLDHIPQRCRCCQPNRR